MCANVTLFSRTWLLIGLRVASHIVTVAHMQLSLFDAAALEAPDSRDGARIAGIVAKVEVDADLGLLGSDLYEPDFSDD